ncbi:MAG TPA: hypothetical protein VM848_17890 [Acidimicrobiia bacterium]|nr:hypothetical protein [Acidimicrobiia bacterium]
MLIDRFLPIYEVWEHHQVEVATASSRAYRAVVDLDLSLSPIIRFLFALRRLPRRQPLTLHDITGAGFVVLGEEPGTEIVLGVTGRFWRVRGGLRRVGPDEFLSFNEPGYAMAAWNFRVEPVSDCRSLVSTETRVATTDLASRRAFRRYWLVVRPFSGLVRRRALALIKKSAESGNL